MLELDSLDGKKLPLLDQELQSPFLSSLELQRAGSFERAIAGMKQLAACAAHGGLRRLVSHRMQQTYRTPVGHELTKSISVKPTHIKYLLAAERSFDDPGLNSLSSPSDEGYKLYANLYFPSKILRHLVGDRLIAPVKNMNYVKHLHNHNVAGIVSVIALGGYEATNYICKRPDDAMETYERSDREYWQWWLARTAFRRSLRSYRAGDVMALRANDFHGLRNIAIGTVSVVLELPPVRYFSATARETGVIRRKLDIEDIFHTSPKQYTQLQGVRRSPFDKLMTDASLKPENAAVIMKLLRTGFEDILEVIE